MKNLISRILVLATVVSVSGSAFAHETGTSRFTLDIGDSAIESRFQIDLLTLLRLVPDLDANRDLQVTPAEANAAVPELAAYLGKRVMLDIDEAESGDWGDALPIIWPDEEGRPVTQADYHRFLVQFPFRRRVEKRPNDVRVTFDVFVEFGGSHRVHGDIGIPGVCRESMTFTHWEPDYLFDIVHALETGGDS